MFITYSYLDSNGNKDPSKSHFNTIKYNNGMCNVNKIIKVTLYVVENDEDSALYIIDMDNSRYHNKYNMIPIIKVHLGAKLSNNPVNGNINLDLVQDSDEEVIVSYYEKMGVSGLASPRNLLPEDCDNYISNLDIDEMFLNIIALTRELFRMAAKMKYKYHNLNTIK